MKCPISFGITSLNEHSSAQLSGWGELHGGTRVITLVTLGKCTSNFKRTTTRSGPSHAEGTACNSPPASPHPRSSLGSAALRPLLGAGGARGPPPPGKHPSVDTPRHPLHVPHALPRDRHRAPAPHLAIRPARHPTGGRGSAWPHDQASVPAEGHHPHVQARRPSHP